MGNPYFKPKKHKIEYMKRSINYGEKFIYAIVEKVKENNKDLIFKVKLTKELIDKFNDLEYNILNYGIEKSIDMFNNLFNTIVLLEQEKRLNILEV